MKRVPHPVRSLRKFFWCVMAVLMISIGYSSGAIAAVGTGSKKVFSQEFEQAVTVIKKYEGLHKNKGSLIGYGHKVIAGDKYKRGANLTEAQADALLRKDLAKLCERYRSFGKDSLILAALAYNCGIGTVAKSSVYKKLLAGDRNIKQSYLAHSKYRGKTLSQLKRRRTEEFELLFVPD